MGCVFIVVLIYFSALCRSEGFPLTGIFHPWAQWDMGLDTLENYSAAAAVAPLGGGREGFTKKLQFPYVFLKTHIFVGKLN